MSSSSAPPTGSPVKQLVLNLAPGFHFLPKDHELVLHYLRPRLVNPNCKLPLPIFIHERILDYHPDELIEKYRNHGEGRWFFFTVRERKHSGGSRPNRTTKDNGHWNATGSIQPIRRSSGVLVGCRRTLVFYEASRRRKKKSSQAAAVLPATEEEEEEVGGQATKGKDDGVKTDWTMYEYESVSSEAEFEAIRNGIAIKMGVVVLCTIQKKKHSQEDGDHETKKSTKRKTKEEEGQEAAAGDVEQGTTETEGQDDEDDVLRRAFMEEAAAAELLPELASYHDITPAGVGSFNVDPNQTMPYYQYHFTNSLSPVPTPPQETVMAPGSEGDNYHNVMLQETYDYYFINQSLDMENSQSLFHAQAATLPQEFLPYSDTTMAAAPRGGTNTMDGMLQNSRLVSMTPSQLALPVMPGTGTYLSPRHSKLDAWESSAGLPGDEPKMPLNSEDAWLPAGRQLNSPYVTNSLSLVPTPPLQETTMAMLAAGGHNYHAAMHQRSYYNHSMIVRDSEFHVQAALMTQEEFLPSSSTQMAGGNVVDHHMLQNRVVDMAPAAAAAEAQAFAFDGYGPVLPNSNYGQGGGEYDNHLSTIMDHPPEPSRFSFPSHQTQGPLLLNNQVSLDLNHQNPAASMVGYDQRKGVGLPPNQDRLR